jgi:hypothetical protein
MDQEKRRLRQLKRDIKRAGKKKRRGQLKRDLREKPEEAHWSEETVGRNSSRFLNRLDHDAKRRTKSTEPEIG